MRTRWLLALLFLPLVASAQAANDPEVQIIRLTQPPYSDGDLEFWAKNQSVFSDVLHLARLGDVNAQYNLAMMAHIRGDMQTATYWYARAASRNHELAAYNLASLYYAGDGVAVDYDQAAKWMERAARLGFAPAQFQLAKMYYQGRGVPKDHAKEAYWLKKAAESGHAAAQHNLAVLYHKGEGVEKNDDLARKWLQKSKESGLEDDGRF